MYTPAYVARYTSQACVHVFAMKLRYNQAFVKLAILYIVCLRVSKLGAVRLGINIHPD